MRKEDVTDWMKVWGQAKSFVTRKRYPNHLAEDFAGFYIEKLLRGASCKLWSAWMDYQDQPETRTEMRSIEFDVYHEPTAQPKVIDSIYKDEVLATLPNDRPSLMYKMHILDDHSNADLAAIFNIDQATISKDLREVENWLRWKYNAG